jgi:hypothetical protein
MLREYLSIEHRYAVHLSPSRVIFRTVVSEKNGMWGSSRISIVRLLGQALSALWGQNSPLAAINVLIEITSKGAWLALGSDVT